MAINNIAATFSTLSLSSLSSSPSSTSSSPPHSINPTTTSPPTSAQSISASWNPQTALPRAHKSSLLSLYGFPGPKPMRMPKPNPSLHLSSILRPKTICVGDRLPNIALSYLDRNDDLLTVSVSDLGRQRKMVLVGTSGAFVPGWKSYLPGFVKRAEELKGKGADVLACVSVNDVHVMKAWGEKMGAGERMMMLSDARGELARAMGVSMDLSDTEEGLGVRSIRLISSFSWHDRSRRTEVLDAEISRILENGPEHAKRVWNNTEGFGIFKMTLK